MRPTAATALPTALAALLMLACSGTGPVSSGMPPRGGDVAAPVPIDHPPSGITTYKGLPLALVDNGAPLVTPVDGVVGVVCVGMSNGNQECEELINQLGGAWGNAVDPAVRVVNCAVGGHAIEKWIDPQYDHALWDACVTNKVPQAGLRPDQVRVLYHKAADQFALAPGGGALQFYPDTGSDYRHFLDNLTLFAARVHSEFPSVLAVYTSSRSYGGFNDRDDRGEPLSYEEGHALNTWLAAHNRVDGVWYGWGAYIWAPTCDSGEVNGSGVCYVRGDFRSDGVHPSRGVGTVKIARQWHERLLEEEWYRR